MDAFMQENAITFLAVYKFSAMQQLSGAVRHVVKSETAKFATRYVPEFLKHFKGSLMNATMSKICDITPKIHTA